MALSFKPIRPLLQTGTNAGSRWLSYIGLCLGVLLLLCSIQMFINVQSMLGGNVIHKNGYDFISVTKKITNETMGSVEKNVFHQDEIDDLKAQPFIEGVAPLVANRFHVQIEAVVFKTDLFLESMDKEYIDTVPPSFQWEEGQPFVPIIVSSDFIEIYNIFAPGQGLPQFSSASILKLTPTITCFGKGKVESFVGIIVAMSDRINSVLVPTNFLQWANERFGEIKETGPSRVFLKTKDANNPELIKYIDSKNYYVNKDKTKFGREKRIVQVVVSALGVVGLLVVVLALMLFSFYLQLVIARSKENLQLLLLLGYSPRWLSRNVSRQFIPIYVMIVITALLISQFVQFFFHSNISKIFDAPELSPYISWIIIAIAFALIILSVITNYRLVRKLLYRMY
ncbi:MAG: FtsX-like permease family protein [Flavisolibacter sp.]